MCIQVKCTSNIEHILNKFIVKKLHLDMLFCNVCLDSSKNIHDEYISSFWVKEAINSCPAHEPQDIHWAKEAINFCPAYEPRDIHWAKEAINSCPAHEPRDIHWAKEAINSCPAHEPRDIHWAKEAINSCPVHVFWDFRNKKQIK